MTTLMAPPEREVSKSVTVDVTPADIQAAAHQPGDNPVTRALLRTLNQTWVVFGGSTAYSRSRPQQSVSLPHEVFHYWELHRKTGVWQPFSFEFDVAANMENIDMRAGGNRQATDRRRHERRESPRFGFDRRARERRQVERRVSPRRSEGANSARAARAGS